MENFPFITGILFLIIGCLLLKYQLKRNNSFKMSEYNTASWGALVKMWALILVSFISGLFLIFKN